MMFKKNPTQEEINSASNWGTWEKEPSVFEWYYEEKETCYILDGEASVSDKKGNTISFKKGDWVEFNAGLSCTWTIKKTIRKNFQFGQ